MKISYTEGLVHSKWECKYLVACTFTPTYLNLPLTITGQTRSVTIAIVRRARYIKRPRHRYVLDSAGSFFGPESIFRYCCGASSRGLYLDHSDQISGDPLAVVLRGLNYLCTKAGLKSYEARTASLLYLNSVCDKLSASEFAYRDRYGFRGGLGAFGRIPMGPGHPCSR